jgi:hypothetical protein
MKLSFWLMAALIFMKRFLFVQLMIFMGTPMQLIGSETISFDQTFSFSQYPGQKEALVNHFLLKIAEGNNKLRVYTSYTFEGSLVANFRSDTEDDCSLDLQYQAYSFSGDVNYRAFSLEKMLLPDRASFMLTISSPGGGVISEKHFFDVSIPKEGTLSLSVCQKEWSVSDRFIWSLTGLEFYYSEAIFDRFDGWFSSLENYYEANKMLQTIPGLLEGLDYDDPEKVILNEFRLCEAEVVLSDVRYALFHRWLNLENGDPEGFIPKYNALVSWSDSLRTGFNQHMSRIDDLLYEKAVMVREMDDHVRAQDLLRQALVYNPVHVPSHLMLIRYELINHDLGGALSRLTDVMSHMFPSVEWKAEAEHTAREVLNASFDEVSELISDGRFLDALAALDQVAYYCSETEGLHECPGALLELQRISHKGMFRSFMLVAERAYRNDNLSFSLLYLANAIDYQREHAEYVPDRRDAEDLLLRLVNRHRALADSMQADGDAAAASIHLFTAREICETYTFINCRQ